MWIRKSFTLPDIHLSVAMCVAYRLHCTLRTVRNQDSKQRQACSLQRQVAFLPKVAELAQKFKAAGNTNTNWLGYLIYSSTC